MKVGCADSVVYFLMDFCCPRCWSSTSSCWFVWSSCHSFVVDCHLVVVCWLWSSTRMCATKEHITAQRQRMKKEHCDPLSSSYVVQYSFLSFSTPMMNDLSSYPSSSSSCCILLAMAMAMAAAAATEGTADATQHGDCTDCNCCDDAVGKNVTYAYMQICI